MRRLFFALLCLGCAASGWAADSEEPLLEFLAAARNLDVALDARTLERLNAVERPPKESPKWAVDTFLRGEIHRLRGDQERSTGAYRSLVNWAASDAAGGSGLAGIALWRLLDNPRAIAQDMEKARALLETAEQLLDKPLMKRFFADPKPRVSISLSRFKEDIVRQLIVVAAGIGDDDTAMQWFLDSIALRTDARVTTLEAGLLERALEAGKVTHSGIVLELGKRLIQLAAIPAIAVLFLSAPCAAPLKRLAAIGWTDPDLPGFAPRAISYHFAPEEHYLAHLRPRTMPYDVSYTTTSVR